ncbi:MAG: hypothetical protein WAK93_15615 [Solirubrobacteraceae bacterium]
MPADSWDDLYGLPLDRFIPERTALVKALRSEKRREEASQVAALRKPSVAAWAVNQLVRTQKQGIQALFAAGDDLADAQARAAAGKGGGDAMREAAHRQREASRELLEAAEGLLSSEGQTLSQTTLDRVAETLRAAAVDEEARRQVKGACLTQELHFVGLGVAVDGLAPSPVTGPPAAVKEKPRSRGSDQGDTEKRAAEVEREAVRQREQALKAARRTEAEARRAATRAAKELAAAQARREEAAASLEEADALLSAASQRAQEASAELTSSEHALRDLAET